MFRCSIFAAVVLAIGFLICFDRPIGAEDRATSEELESLKTQYKRLSDSFGARHPRVMSLQSQIQTLESEMNQLPAKGPTDATQMNDMQLRVLVNQLRGRIEELETQVDSMRRDTLPHPSPGN